MRMFRTVLEQKIWERRQTFEEFAEYAETFAREHDEPGTLGVRHLQRLAAGRGPNGRPLGQVRPATARLLERILGLSVDELLAAPAAPAGANSAGTPARSGPRVADRAADVRDVDGAGSVCSQDIGISNLATLFEWLDERSGWMPDTSRRKVKARMAKLSTGDVLDRHIGRTRVRRSQVVRALAEYYADDNSRYGACRAQVGTRVIATCVLSNGAWLNFNCELTPGSDRLVLADTEFGVSGFSDDIGAECAVNRLAEHALLDVRVVNAPLYRLLDVDFSRGMIVGSVGLAPFVEYALTMDLLECELLDSVIAGRSTRHGGLPMRDRYLPDLASVVDIGSRLCAGGIEVLCAIARPVDPYRGDADYALLVQERSGHVLNAAGRLAVIPKGFHQPLKDVRADARIGATLRREMEEELFGRSEVDSTVGKSRVAASMHPNRLSAPMRWLLDEPGRLRMECTGFGLNLVSGNYEFASLIVIEDEEFWVRYGGDVEANWESAGLRLYSSLDRQLIANLISDESWCNEGLFALLLGLQRLQEIGGRRVDLPAIEVEAVGGS